MEHKPSTKEHEALRSLADRYDLSLQQAFELSLARIFREKMPESFMETREKVDPQVLGILDRES